MYDNCQCRFYSVSPEPFVVDLANNESERSRFCNYPRINLKGVRKTTKPRNHCARGTNQYSVCKEVWPGG